MEVAEEKKAKYMEELATYQQTAAYKEFQHKKQQGLSHYEISICQLDLHVIVIIICPNPATEIMLRRWFLSRFLQPFLPTLFSTDYGPIINTFYLQQVPGQ